MAALSWKKTMQKTLRACSFGMAALVSAGGSAFAQAEHVVAPATVLGPQAARYLVTYSVERHDKPEVIEAQLARHEVPRSFPVLLSGTTTANGGVSATYYDLPYRKSVVLDEKGRPISTERGTVKVGGNLGFTVIPEADGKVVLSVVGDVSYPTDPAYPFREVRSGGGVIDVPSMETVPFHPGPVEHVALGGTAVFTLSPEVQLRTKVERAS